VILRILRHGIVATTQNHYIKTVASVLEAEAALRSTSGAQ